jgi:NADP-dependent 3-hydroxy acid dehydrogenase YdfG
VENSGKVGVIVTNASIVEGSPAETYGPNRWQWMFNVNINGTFWFAQAEGKHMIYNKIEKSTIIVRSISRSIVNLPQK